MLLFFNGGCFGLPQTKFSSWPVFSSTSAAHVIEKFHTITVTDRGGIEILSLQNFIIDLDGDIFLQLHMRFLQKLLHGQFLFKRVLLSVDRDCHNKTPYLLSGIRLAFQNLSNQNGKLV